LQKKKYASKLKTIEVKVYKYLICRIRQNTETITILHYVLLFIYLYI